jgi:DNA-directed RNA polymerase subunit M/transcription elongation factor TFIIS
MSATTRLGRTVASGGRRHPLNTREKRTPLNYALRAKGIPAKACSMCWVIKATSQFNKKSTASDGLDPHCRTCNSAMHATRKATDADYSRRHRESAMKSARKRYPGRRDVISQQGKKRRAEFVIKNASRVKDPNVLRRCGGQCGQMLPETEFRLNRGDKSGLRARCNHCSDAWKRARQACLKAYGDPGGQCCYLCGTSIAEKSEAWVDHVIPQSQGGPDTAENVRWTHGACNLARGTKPLTPEQFQRAIAIGPLPAALYGVDL